MLRQFSKAVEEVSVLFPVFKQRTFHFCHFTSIKLTTQMLEVKKYQIIEEDYLMANDPPILSELKL